MNEPLDKDDIKMLIDERISRFAHNVAERLRDSVGWIEAEQTRHAIYEIVRTLEDF